MTNPACLPGIGDHLDEEFNNWRHTPEAGAYISRFVQLAVQQKNRGRKVSAKSIVHHLRDFDDEPLPFPNALVSRLSRYVMACYPELGDYFATAALTAHKKAA